MTKINVLVIDDSTMLHRNFTRFLADVSEINLISQVAKSKDALQKIKDLQPDVGRVVHTCDTNTFQFRNTKATNVILFPIDNEGRQYPWDL